MTVPITGSVKDVTGVEDNDTPWSFASVIRFADDGSVITEKPREVRAVSGNLKVNLVPGYAIVTYGKQVWQVTVPETPTTLKALIEAGVAFPPDTSQALLDAAVGQYVETHREQFRTRAVPITTGPDAGKVQWYDENGLEVGGPVTWDQVIPTEVAQAAVEAVAQAAVEAEAPAAVGQAAADMNPVPVPGPTPGKIVISFNGTTGDEFNPYPATWTEVVDRPPALAEWDIYNWKNSNTRRIQRSIAKALSGQATDQAVFGDSTSAGYVGSMDHRAGWAWLLRTQLSLRGVPLGGTGWIFPCNDNAYALDPRWATSGTWTKSFGYMSTSSGSATFISDLPGTTVRIATTTTSGAYTVSVDGAAAVTITPTGSAGQMYIGEITGLADTVHTVVITRSSGTVTLHAAGVFRATGLQIHNCALIGMNAQYWAAESSTLRGWAVNRLNLNPDVIYLGLGVNDLNYSRTITQAIADLTAIREDWPNADAVLIAQPQPASSTVPTPQTDGSWAAWVAALYELADDLDVPLLDWYRITGGSYTAANAAGLMGDPVHPNKTAHALLAMATSNALTRKAGLV